MLYSISLLKCTLSAPWKHEAPFNSIHASLLAREKRSCNRISVNPPPSKEKLSSDVAQTCQAPHVCISTFFSSLFLFLYVNLSTMARNSYSMESEMHGGCNCPCAHTHVATKPIFVYLYIFVTLWCGNSKACQLKRNIPFMFIFDIEFKYNSVDLLQTDVWLVLMWACICGGCIVSPQAINKDLFCCLHRSKPCLFYNNKD